MTFVRVKRCLPIAALVAVLLASCDTPVHGPSAVGTPIPDLAAMADTIASSSGFAKGALELTVSSVRLSVVIADNQLATADEATRSSAAMRIVASCEQMLATHAEFAGMQSISIAIVHGGDGSGGAGWHVEDIIDFRKGPGGRFAVHVS